MLCSVCASALMWLPGGLIADCFSVGCVCGKDRRNVCLSLLFFVAVSLSTRRLRVISLTLKSKALK